MIKTLTAIALLATATLSAEEAVKNKWQTKKHVSVDYVSDSYLYGMTAGTGVALYKNEGKFTYGFGVGVGIGVIPSQRQENLIINGTTVGIGGDAFIKRHINEKINIVCGVGLGLVNGTYRIKAIDGYSTTVNETGSSISVSTSINFNIDKNSAVGITIIRTDGENALAMGYSYKY